MVPASLAKLRSRQHQQISRLESAYCQGQLLSVQGCVCQTIKPSQEDIHASIKAPRNECHQGVAHISTNLENSEERPTRRSYYKLPLILAPQPEGGYTVTCPILPELITEGNTVPEAMENVRDALAVALEIYDDLGKPFPRSLTIKPGLESIWFETLVSPS